MRLEHTPTPASSSLIKGKMGENTEHKVGISPLVHLFTNQADSLGVAQALP